jgi:large subunit ribosomal protein L29
MKAKELRALPKAQLKKRLEEFKKELFKLGSKGATGGNVENPGKVKNLKRIIARIKTLEREEELKSLSKKEKKGKKI